jgi:transcriptional regulator
VDAPQVTLVPGTLDMLVLKTVSLAPMHGWGICDRIQSMSRDVFRVNQGSLYPALERLLHAGLITSEWRLSDSGRRARYYAITRAGTKRLAAEYREWEIASNAVDLIMRTV